MTQTPQAPGAGAGNPYGITLYTVTTPSGSEYNLQTQEEADWYENRRDRYTSDNHFPNVSDLQDLDRLLTLEVMIYRWSLWLGQGFDYMYSRVDEGQLKNNIKEYSVETRLLKASLGIDKATRDKEKGESLADYTAQLLQRAKEFGYHRNQQYEIVVTKFYELSSMVKTYDRCDEEERNQLDLSMETIFEWIRDRVIKDFDEHSAAFRKNQAIWVRDM
jgi:hypothetical protein